MKKANQIDSDCYDDDDVDTDDDNGFGVPTMSLVNSETLGLRDKPMLQLPDLGVLWVMNDVRLVRRPSPSRHVLNHRDRRYPWEGGRCVAVHVTV